MVKISIRLLSAASVNIWSVGLADNISDTAAIIGLVSTASLNPGQLTASGVLVVDRTDSTGTTATPAKREYISFASISGATIYAVTRALAGSTAQSHSASARVEDIPSVTHWGDLMDFIKVEHISTDGTHSVMEHVRQISFTGVSGASGIKGDVVIVPGSNVSIYAVSGASGHSYVNISGPTVAGVGGIVPFSVIGTLANATNVTPMLIVEDAATLKSASAVLKSPVSSASLVLDINLNFTSIFTNQATRLAILGGGTYASTASVGTTALATGNLLSLDLDNSGGADLTVLLET